MSRFPFPMPFGWFKVAMADELAPGAVQTVNYFGKEWVLWRDANGRAAMQEPWCPHLGAHLGLGSVDGGCLRCTFHGWGFDVDGANTDIPYADKPNRKATLTGIPLIDHHGMLLAWWHPHGEAPKWQPLDFPEFDDPQFEPVVIRQFTIGTCMQEMAENGADHAHFQYVHSHPKVGITESVELDGYDRVIRTVQEFPSSRGPVPGRIDISSRGPGLAITRYQGLVKMALVGTSTPIDDTTTRLDFHFLVHNPDRDDKINRIGKAMVESVSKEVLQDVPIWETKRYQATPALAPSEKPIIEFRKWFSQFYAA